MWCELCRGHFSVSHWTKDFPPEHLVGEEYGPWGAREARLQTLEAENDRLQKAINDAVYGCEGEISGERLDRLTDEATDDL